MARQDHDRNRPGAGPALALLLLGLAGTAPVLAATQWSQGLSPLDNPELDQQRGGFQLGNLEISIGLEQIVAIDGQIEVVNRLMINNLNQRLNQGPVVPSIEQVRVNVPEVNVPSVAGGGSGSSGGSSGSSGSPSGSTGSPVSSGSGSTVIAGPVINASPASIAASDLRSGAWMTRIQNDVNDRVIQNLQSLNIELKNVGLPSYLPEVLGDQFLQTPAR
ncbi:hypothetical protein [Marinobacter bohaiensis]|uniref:hypothetical protein n=1 Tax=Marinobacter bohaiensis TaxID=2201898 RepID=UPI0019551516|nr:hypothetical protein [Marinobacter bohaiensis]